MTRIFDMGKHEGSVDDISLNNMLEEAVSIVETYYWLDFGPNLRNAFTWDSAPRHLDSPR